MKVIEEIRRENLKTLVNEFGKLYLLADKLNRAPAQVSLWLNGSKAHKTGRRRGISNDSARYIEKIIGKPRGWLDEDHGLPYIPKNKTTELIAKLVDQMDDEQDRQMAIKIINAISQSKSIVEIERKERLLEK